MAALHLLMTCRCSQKVRFQAETQIQTAAAPQRKGLYPTADVSLFSPVLCAIKEDSEKVPTLLTDYILKGNVNICHSVQQIIKEMKRIRCGPLTCVLLCSPVSYLKHREARGRCVSETSSTALVASGLVLHDLPSSTIINHGSSPSTWFYSPQL